MTRILPALFAATLAMGIAAPAQAQFFFQPPDLRGAPVDGSEPGIVGQPPEVTREDQRAMVFARQLADFTAPRHRPDPAARGRAPGR